MHEISIQRLCNPPLMGAAGVALIWFQLMIMLIQLRERHKSVVSLLARIPA